MPPTDQREGGSGPVEPVDDQEGLRSSAICRLGDGGLVQVREDPAAASSGVHHAAQLDLVHAKAIQAEEADQLAVPVNPQEVVHLVGRPGLKRAPLQLEAPSVSADAGIGQGFDLGQVIC